mgnify:CR=1 FL=1
MKIAYFDCISGASGDMILGALIDAGVPLKTLLSQLDALNLKGYQLTSRKVAKNGFSATKVDVLVQDEHTERHLADILAIVQGSNLPGRVIEQASRVFSRMAEVEAGIHGTGIEQVHLHELGGIDTIIDVVGAFLGLHLLGIEKVVASPLPMGRGFTRGAHGAIPLPAPATLGLLKGVPIVGSEIDFELVTPTGAALLSAMSESFGPIPAMQLEAVGYGAGGKDLPIPNLLRILIGKETTPLAATTETLVLLETNIDDMNPQVYEYVIERLFGAGALDVTLASVQMKKNRPGTQLSVLCHPSESSSLEAILFAETSTLGIRKMTVERHALQRSFETVETPYGSVRMKIAHWAEGHSRAAPEYEDCKRLAESSGAPLWDIYRAALSAYQSSPG